MFESRTRRREYTNPAILQMSFMEGPKEGREKIRRRDEESEMEEMRKNNSDGERVSESGGGVFLSAKFN